MSRDQAVAMRDRAPAGGRRRRAVALLLAALAGFAVGQFVAGISVLRSVFPLSVLQDAGSGLARRLASWQGLQPNGAHPYRREQFELFTRPVDVVMIGDSITQAGIWEDMFPGVTVANRGIGSDRTDDVLRRLGPILELRPRKAFVMLGINDLNVDRGVDDTYSDYVRIVDALRARGVQVVVQSTLQCNRTLRRRCDVLLPRIRELDARLAAFAARERLRYVDLNEALSSPREGLMARYTLDGVHLNGRGYQRWAAVISPLVREASDPSSAGGVREAGRTN